MIRPNDFEIDFRETLDGVTVSVLHRPTGNRRVCVADRVRGVGYARETLIKELEGLLYAPDDIRIDIGCSPAGDWLRVVHLPTGIERSAMRRESSERELLDAVLTAVFARDRGPS